MLPSTPGPVKARLGTRRLIIRPSAAASSSIAVSPNSPAAIICAVERVARRVRNSMTERPTKVPTRFRAIGRPPSTPSMLAA
jgi:hypothetical protein